MSVLPGMPWMEGIDAWRREVTAELTALPSTLRQLREGVDNFQRITKRLLDATDAMEQLTRLYAGGLGDTRRRIEEINRTVQKQIGSPASEVVANAVSELGDALSAMARLNPLWPRPTPGSADTSGSEDATPSSRGTGGTRGSATEGRRSSGRRRQFPTDS